MSRLVDVLYPVPDRARTPLTMLKWWESRRAVYNGVVGGAGLVTLIGMGLLSLLPGGAPPLHPGMVILPAIAYGIVANVCYTLGWAIEVVARWVWGSAAPQIGPFLFREGLFFSMGLTLLPLGVFTVMSMLGVLSVLIS